MPLDSSVLDEADLIARVHGGDSAAFHALFQRHSPPLLATLRSVLANRDDASEVLQETWLRAFENLAHLRDTTRLRPWLVSIALNLARERRRRERVGREPLLEPAVEDEGSERLERDEDLAALQKHMAELPARQREVVDLRVNHELSHAEIAAQLAISEEASRANYYQGLRRLKQALRGCEK